jgi:hypothetical protein
MIIFILLSNLFFGNLKPDHNLQNKNFEGKIVFTKTTLTDTLSIVWQIKGDYARIEYFDHEKQLTKYKILNRKTGDVITASPDRKLYKQSFYKSTDNDVIKDLEVEETHNYKDVDGKRCYQWLVKNTKTNTLVSYWLVKEKLFDFTEFQEMVESSEKLLNYYPSIPNAGEFFPLETTERSLLWEYRMSYTVTEIKQTKINDSVFKLPNGYKLFE